MSVYAVKQLTFRDGEQKSTEFAGEIIEVLDMHQPLPGNPLTWYITALVRTA
jgi:hypothetical protein